jgi:hypothetical protein
VSAFKNTLPGVHPSGRLQSIPFRSRRNGRFPLWLPFAWTLSRIELATAKPAGPLSPAGPQEQRADQKPLPFLRVEETPAQTVGLPCQYPPFPAACPDMGEAQEVERRRLAFPASARMGRCIATKLNEPRLLGVKLQTKAGEPLV